MLALLLPVDRFGESPKYKLGAGEARVAADAHARPGVRRRERAAHHDVAEDAAERVGELIGQIAVGDAADVVLAESVAGDLHGRFRGARAG